MSFTNGKDETEIAHLAMVTRAREESEEILLELESVVELYKSLRHGADELDKLSFLAALKDFRNILSRSPNNRNLRRKEILDFQKLLKVLKSRAQTMAFKQLFQELTGVKFRIEVLERQLEVTKPVQLPTICPETRGR